MMTKFQLSFCLFCFKVQRSSELSFFLPPAYVSSNGSLQVCSMALIIISDRVGFDSQH